MVKNKSKSKEKYRSRGDCNWSEISRKRNTMEIIFLLIYSCKNYKEFIGYFHLFENCDNLNQIFLLLSQSATAWTSIQRKTFS